MRETKRAKALRYLSEERVHVLTANEAGIRIEVRGSALEPYKVAFGCDARGNLVTSCTCVNGSEYHPVAPRCAHVEVCRLLRRMP